MTFNVSHMTPHCVEVNSCQASDPPAYSAKLRLLLVGIKVHTLTF